MTLLKLANGDTEDADPVESYDDNFRKPKPAKTAAKNVQYLLNQIPKEPKVRPLQAEAPEPKYRVKVGGVPGVFGLPTGDDSGGFDPAKQLASTQKIGVPKMEQPKVEPIKVKMSAVQLRAMLDEMLKLNGMATTPQGRLHQTQIVGQPKQTEESGPSIASLSKPYGYGHAQPGATKNTI